MPLKGLLAPLRVSGRDSTRTRLRYDSELLRVDHCGYVGHERATLERAGLSVTHATFIKWLAGDERNVRRTFREIIHQAYKAAAMISRDAVPQAFKDHQFEICGVVRAGTDKGDRGVRALRRCASRDATATQPSIEAPWNDGVLGDGEFEDDFIDYVICE